MKNTLKNDNDLLLKFILPNIETIEYSPEVSYDINNILFMSGNIFGDIASGKSSVARYIAEEAVKKYGKSKVNCVLESSANIIRLMKYGLRNKLVNILFSDDLTLRKIDREVLSLFFRIRHYHKERFGSNNGYILSLLGLHRFHSCVPELKNPQFLIITTLPSNPYDYSLTKKFIGEEAMELLQDIEEYRVDDPEYKKYSIYWLRTGNVGLLTTPLAQDNYMELI